MSRIDDLVKQHAPNGVPFEPLGELCTVLNGYAFKSTYFNGAGLGVPLVRIRDVNTGFSDTYYSGEYDDRWLVADGDILIGMDGDFRANRWRHGRALLNQRVCRLQDFSQEVLPAFLFYKVQDELDQIHKSIQGSTVKHLSSRRLEQARIPVPPADVQREIVRILDAFTGLEAELEAELEARRQQYAHYTHELLSRPGGIETVLGNALALIIDRRGITPKKLGSEWTTEGHRVVSALNVKNGAVDDNDHHYIDDATYYRWMPHRLRAGDVLLTSEAPLGAVAYIESDVDWAVGQRLFALRPDPEKVHGRFLYHLLRAGKPRKEILARATGSTVTGIRQAELVKVGLVLPDIDEQRRVASILDSFDALVNDLSRGLPAEIEARRKQYAYYRDRLLTFEEAAA